MQTASEKTITQTEQIEVWLANTSFQESHISCSVDISKYINANEQISFDQSERCSFKEDNWNEHPSEQLSQPFPSDQIGNENDQQSLKSGRTNLKEVLKLIKSQRKHFFQHLLICLRSLIRVTDSDADQLIATLNLSISNRFSKKFFLKMIQTEQGQQVCQNYILNDLLLKHAMNKIKNPIYESTKELVIRYYPLAKDLITNDNVKRKKIQWSQYEIGV